MLIVLIMQDFGGEPARIEYYVLALNTGIFGYKVYLSL